jgi:hypothetical protein
MIKRMTQFLWQKRALERLGTPKDIAEGRGWGGPWHMPPTPECIEVAYAAALHAFESGLPVEGVVPCVRVSADAKPYPGNSFLWGDMPADVDVMLGKHWAAKKASVRLTFKADGPTIARGYFGYVQRVQWEAPFTEALWERIRLWLLSPNVKAAK